MPKSKTLNPKKVLPSLTTRIRTESEEVKFTLVVGLLKELRQAHADLINENKSSRDHYFAAREVGRGYAAVVLSVVTYGYNVANRSPLSANLGKETAISPSDFNQEGRYQRANITHPSRQFYGLLIQLLEDKAYPKLAEFVRRQQKPELITYISDGKRKERKTSHLGQWKRPEEVLEYVFERLPLLDVFALSIGLLENEKKLLSNKAALARNNLESVSWLYRSKQAKEEVKTRGVSSQSLSIHAALDEKRKAIVTAIASQINSSRSGHGRSMLPCEAPPSGFPCVMFDLIELVKLNGRLYESYQKIKQGGLSDLTSLGDFIISLFTALINYESIYYYGENFILTLPQSSFASLRPSFSTTGRSIRLSPGLVPDNFSIVVNRAYQTLSGILSEQKAENTLVRLFKNFHRITSIFHGGAVNQTAVMRFMSLLSSSETSVGAFRKYCELIFKGEVEPKKSKAVSRSLNTAVQREKDFLSAYEQFPCFSAGKKTTTALAPAPLQLLRLFDKLIHMAEQDLPQKNKFGYAYCLTDFLQVLNQEIKRALRLSKQNQFDYSHVIGSIETLFRLLQLKQTIKLTSKRHRKHYLALVHAELMQSALVEQAHQPEASARAIHLNATKFRSGAPSLELKPLPLKRSPSLDFTYSPNEIGTRSGMAALYKVLVSIVKAKQALEGKVSYRFVLDPVYFEVTPFFLNLSLRYYQSQKKGGFLYGEEIVQNSFSSRGGQLNASTTIEVRVTDLAPIPIDTLGQGKNPACVWAKDAKQWPEKRPMILIVDTTSATESSVARLVNQFNQQLWRPHILILFSSRNKLDSYFDLVSMGKIQIHKKAVIRSSTQRELINPLYAQLQRHLNQGRVEENTTAGKAYRQLQQEIDSSSLKQNLVSKS